MKSRSAAAPAYAYALAVVAGLLLAPYMYALAQLLGGVSRDGYATMWAFFWAAFAVAYATLGAAFGLLWPGRTWRWGVWLSAAPLCAASFFSPGAAFYAGLILASLLPSAACAYAAGRYGLKAKTFI